MNNLFIFPTDTVYALACKFDNEDAYSEIIKIKERDPLKLLPVLTASIEDLESIVEVNDIEKHFIDKFMPGSLTIIVKVREDVELIRCGNRFTTLALRIPNNELALKELRDNGPMFATSLNKSGEDPLTDESEIIMNYSSLVSNIKTDNVPRNNVPSTIISIDKQITIIREGQIKKEILINEYNIKNLK